MSRKLIACRTFYVLFLLGMLLLFSWQWRSGEWLQTDLRSLLPKESQWAAVQQEADERQEQQLNRRVVGLVGHRDSARAFALAAQTAEDWLASGLFSSIFYQTIPDLAGLQKEIAGLSFATLPAAIRRQLSEKPADYFQQYAEQIANPFLQTNLLPLEQDWLGFGRFVLNRTELSRLRWHTENGMLFTEKNGVTWVLLQAELGESSLINPNTSLSEQISNSREQLTRWQGQLLITGAPLFAVQAKQQAESESLWMSLAGVSLTLLLLLVVFRSLRVLWLFLPIGVGMFCGVAATVALLGQIHILTLVVGTSLIGVLIDFPLHWLSGSLFHIAWQGQRAMRKLHSTFFISLLVTLLGYLLLGFTPLAVLQQTALFSAVALFTALLATIWFLPPLFRSYSSKGRAPFWVGAYRAITGVTSIKRVLGYVLVGLFLLAGLGKSRWQDDIRDWVALPEPLLAEAKQVAEIAGVDLSSQYFLVTAENDEMLLSKEQSLIKSLLLLQQQGKIATFQALSQWMMSASQQKAFAEQLSRLSPQHYAILMELGLDTDKIGQALQQLREQEPTTLQAALQTEIGQAWQPFYLGRLGQGLVGSVVKLQGLQDFADIQPLVNGKDIFWQDKRQALNRAFEQSRNQAAWLKLLSFGLAGLLLWKLFGLRSMGRMLLAPLGGITATVAVFGWLGMPISLFAMFGLLLVSAISIDYTAYMQTADEPYYAKCVAVVLAAITTLISFVLLSLSATPAVAAFGLSVSLGVVFSLLITLKIFR